LLAPADLDGVGVVLVVGDMHQLHGIADRHALRHPLLGGLKWEGHVGGEDLAAAFLMQALAGQLPLAGGGLIQIGKMLEQGTAGSHQLRLAHWDPSSWPADQAHPTGRQRMLTAMAAPGHDLLIRRIRCLDSRQVRARQR
jgi:hypothetical protein